ncbi:MAG TPA: class I SAM-dependent methyltransferase [Bryobacteraceae bacterium]|nr:class I SAM-dependent methyltransferase [Bryobacteraceae bacterium]
MAKWYAANTRKSLNDFKTLARQVADELRPGSRVLEVAPGPGYFAIELAKLGDYQVDGLDISRTFVEIAHRNAREANVDVAFQQGNASSMPYADESFDYILCRAAFKNFAEPVKALQEMCRVLKPGGQGLLIDLRRDASREAVHRMMAELGMSPLNSLFTRLTFRFMLLKRAYTGEEFKRFFAQTKFRSVKFEESLTGFEIYFER